MDSASTDSALTTLKTVFGFDTYRPGQREVIEHVLAGGDGLVIMPTGGGKSMCFQLPSLLREGLGVVVSPLIALMEDQVFSLKENGVRAAVLNSTLNGAEAFAVETATRQGELDLLYLSPERILQPRTLDMLRQTKLALIAIDEAHCVSQWGHDFRPEYLQLAQLAEAFPGVPRLALTATADPDTRREILLRLAMPDGRAFVGGFDRPNIRYTITERTAPRQQLLRFLASHRGESGIVYCLTRNDVEEYAAFLASNGYDAYPYHAGMDTRRRTSTQRYFQQRDGAVIVATIAFGMGVDKPDVRFVAHMNLPKSIEAYYQETGRAGRDGEPADAWMSYSLQDVILLRRFIDDGAADETRKRFEHERLNTLVGFCESPHCRREMLLRYFGDSHEGGCDNCDNCIRPPDMFDATVPAQKALSCAYRSEQRFGVMHLVDVLRGKTTEKVRRFGHENLSTFGIGGELSEKQWKSLFRQLVAGGYCDVDPRQYNAVKLNARSYDILKGRCKLQARKTVLSPAKKSQAEKPARKQPVEFDRVDAELADTLKEWRFEKATQANRPAFTIFSNRTLRALATLKPLSHEELLDVPGIGQTKAEHYGPEILDIIAKHEGK
ncbi:MAG: DNA helicase RecQ [Phycisphaerae bacterium]|nr:DNA helicase RecQ [Phycisphaerae bacterium]